MIKCNVTVCGTITRQAQMRTNKEGRSFLSMGVSVVVPAKSGINKTYEISVAKFDAQIEELANYPLNTRVEVVGSINMHKKDETLYLNMTATGINTFSAGNEDSITGTIEFKGTVGNKIETKTDKKGKPYLVFSAFSSEKNGEDFVFTWVRFMQFGKEQEGWLQPKTKIESCGDLQLEVFNDRLNITCRVAELKEWIKQEYTPNQ